METLGAYALLLAFCLAIYAFASVRDWQAETETVPDRQR